MPYYTYILISLKNGRKYYGSCEDMEIRLKRHNAGLVKSTKSYIPYRVLYIEEYDTRSEAFAREKFFKTLDGYNYLKNKRII